MKKTTQFLFYILFAAISTLINIGTQVLIEYLINISKINLFQLVFIKNITFGFFIKMFIATIVAFIFKFLVDKIFIFEDKSKEIKENIRQIFFYGFFAVFTTIIFWGTELVFKIFFVFSFSEYIGAVLGLAIGYTIKFLLDRKYVFIN
jgi:putative flippase GtrA